MKLVRPSSRAVAIMMLSMFLFACLDATSKILAQDYAITQILWVRYLFFVAFAALLARRRTRLGVAMRSRARGLQIARSVLLIGEIGLFILALKYLPLADVHALAAITPLLVIALSGPLLGERVEWQRWAAVLSGFVGVLIIVRPGFAEIGWPIGIALAAALAFAVYQVMLRVVARHDRSETTVLYSAIVGAVALSAVGPLEWRAPDATGWALLMLLGLVGSSAHFTLTMALELGEASRLQPYVYTLLLWAAALGLVVFGQFPDAWTILGGGVIAASGLYAVYRERAAAPAKR